jgi:hypothetical protein
MLTTLAPTARAAVMYQNVDISPMIENFRSQVKTINKTVVTYNWSSGATPEKFTESWSLPWSKNKGGEKEAFEKAASDKEAAQTRDTLQGVRQMANSFWRNYGDRTNYNMYGFGLYTAADPVSTRGYGSSDGWRMLEIKLLPGTRILDLVSARYLAPPTTPFSDAAQDIEEKFGCPRSNNADTYFTEGGKALDPKCINLIYQVFERGLGVDALAYNYSATSFKECKSGQQDPAFVIMRPDVVRSNTVHLYTAVTRTNEADRIRIQTLFAKSETEKYHSSDEFKDVLLNHFNAFPDRDFSGAKTVCTGETCVISVEFCDSQKTCDTVALPAMPRPGGPLLNVDEYKDVQKILWPDLMGKPKSTTISTWLIDNKYGCSGTLPYGNK